MFDLGRFLADCRVALAEDKGGHRAVREVVAHTVSRPGGVLAALGEPRRAEVRKLHHAPDLTILNVIWGPRMTIMPHDHRMWAVISAYAGCEDNILGAAWEAAGAKAPRAGGCAALGEDLIHSVTNPIGRLTGAIHVYHGDFFGADRSEWDPETLREQRHDAAKNMRLFEESNTALAAAR